MIDFEPLKGAGICNDCAKIRAADREFDAESNIYSLISLWTLYHPPFRPHPTNCHSYNQELRARKIELEQRWYARLAAEAPVISGGSTVSIHSEAGDAVQAKADEIRLTSATGGQKGSKLARFDLVPPQQLLRLAEHYGKGAAKYSDDNYRKGYDWKLSIAALERHLNAFKSGEDIDEETESLHIIAAAWHCFTLAEFYDVHPEYDTRLKTVEQRGLRASQDSDNGLRDSASNS